MFIRLRKNRAQSTLEYAILIGVIVAGLIAMQVYLKRGFQGKLRDNADNMGKQFSPGHTAYTATTTSSSASNENFEDGVSTTSITNQTTDRGTTDNVENFDQEQWW